MKNFIKTIIICTLSVLIAFSTVSFAANAIMVSIDGDDVEFDVQPQIINNRTMVPLRAIFEALGAEVNWDGDTQTVFAKKDDITVTATIGSTKMYIGSEEKTMDVAPLIIDGRTLVPVRFVAEAFDCEVFWSDEDYAVYIKTKNSMEDINDDVGQE